jgi:hypothetical protein
VKGEYIGGRLELRDGDETNLSGVSSCKPATGRAGHTGRPEAVLVTFDKTLEILLASCEALWGSTRISSSSVVLDMVDVALNVHRLGLCSRYLGLPHT